MAVGGGRVVLWACVDLSKYFSKDANVFVVWGFVRA